MSKKKLIYIEWADAISTSRWYNNEGLKEWINKAEWIVKQVGWIIEEKPKYIVIAGSHVPPTERGEEQWGNIQKIPKTWIRKRKRMKI